MINNSWDYRVVRRESEGKTEEWVSIQEVYYDEDTGDPIAQTSSNWNTWGELMIGASPVIDDANEHPALISGIKTFFSGFINFAVSAIKCTPQRTIISAFVFDASTAKASESAEISATP